MTEETQELWCVHVPGPDDVYAAVSRDAAEEHADALNVAMARFNDRHPRTENDPSEESMVAVVVRWPWDAESHAADVRKWGSAPRKTT